MGTTIRRKLSTDSSRPQKLDVLAVDDEPSITEMLAAALSPDYDVRQASGVCDALLAIGVRTPDVVVTDLQMEGGGGKYLLAVLADEFPTIVRIVHSAASPADLDQLVVSGLAHAVVGKSGRWSDLAAEMKRLVAGELTMAVSS